jgi:3-oxoacyl-[acyl-carrier-protein] synthase-3
MRYTSVYVNTFGYELPPNVVTSDDIENRLEPLYEALHFKKGQLEALTGIRERRFWDQGHTNREGAIRAGLKALETAAIPAHDIGMLIYGGVCRDHLEPATACAVAHGLDLRADTTVYDVSNACLGVINGMLQVANAIELGQIKAGIIVSCETARQIVEITIHRLLETKDMEVFKKCVATLTGGSGAVAVVMSDGSYVGERHRLLGGTVKSATQHHKLCCWGPDMGVPSSGYQVMETDSVGVLKNGVILGVQTYQAFKQEMNWPADKPDKIICHQVGSAHQRTILESIGIPAEKDFTTFEYLGNIGTVSLPITAAIAEEREFMQPGDLVGFFGIGSGLNCIMLGIEW